jgi:hypothetical protein
LGIVYWALGQLFSYSIAEWLLFVVIAFACAWALHGPGIFLGHIITAVAIATFDVQWIQSEMHKPEWNGQPDQDFVFMIGVVIRIILINTVLLPVSYFASRLNRQRKLRRAIRPVAKPANAVDRAGG